MVAVTGRKGNQCDYSELVRHIAKLSSEPIEYKAPSESEFAAAVADRLGMAHNAFEAQLKAAREREQQALEETRKARASEQKALVEAEQAKEKAEGLVKELLGMTSKMMGSGWEDFLGDWTDGIRSFRVMSDYTVKFTFSQIRDVATFKVINATVDGGVLRFTLTFPPDAGNPDGIAHWSLHKDGRVFLQYNHVMPNGKRFEESPQMTRQ